MGLHVPDGLATDVVEWAQYFYGPRLVGIVFYDPRAAGQNYPCGEINLLIVLTEAPESVRERYDLTLGTVIEVVMGGGFEVVCRIQTIEELQALMEMRMPLLDIYLRDCQIAHDTGQALCTLRGDLLSSS